MRLLSAYRSDNCVLLVLLSIFSFSSVHAATVTYDFSDTVPTHVSKSGTGSSHSDSGSLGEFTNSNLNTQNGSTAFISTGTKNLYPMMSYQFSISEAAADISSITVTWVGEGDSTKNNEDGAALYILNASDSSYQSLSGTSNSGTNTLSGAVSSNISNYINGGVVEVLSVNRKKNANGHTSVHYTDYVKIDIETTGGGGSSGCSGYVNKATLNEFFKDEANMSNSSSDLLEIKLLDGSLTDTDYDGWTVKVCEEDQSGNKNDNDGCSGEILVSTLTDSSSPWLVWKGTAVGAYINFKTGFDAILKDSAGKPIDYFSFNGYTSQEDTSCTSYSYPTTASGSGYKMIYRSPDGTGSWVGESSASTPPTEGSSNDGGGGSATLSYYVINTSGTGITCEPHAFTVSAIDDNGDPIDIPSGTTLTISTDIANDGVTSPSGSGSSYTLTADASSVAFTVSKSVADTLEIDIQDGDGNTDDDGNRNDDYVEFSETGFRFVDASNSLVIPMQISGKASNVVPDAIDLYLQAIKTSDSDPSVCTTLFDNDSVTIGLAAQCDNPTSCVSGQTMNIKSGNSTAVDIALNGSPTAPVNYSDVVMEFTSGKAPYRLNYSDAGLMQLHASYTEPVTGAVMTGSSDQFVVRPNSLGFSAITDGSSNSNPAGDEKTTTSGSGFVSAGSDFFVEVNAYNLNGDVTPNFAWAASLAVSSYTPASGTSGTLSGGDVLAGDWSVGTASGASATLQYDEVGSISLQATVTDYLGESDADVQSSADKVGRFYPDHFVLKDVVVTEACGSFTYMQQPFGTFEYTLEARAADGVEVTQNYDDSTLNYNSTALPDAHTSPSAGVDLGRLENYTSTLGVLGHWVSGQYVVSNADTLFQRLGGVASGLEDGPYLAMQISLSLLSDMDSRNFRVADMDTNPDGSSCSVGVDCTAMKLGSEQELLYGRLFMQSVHGPETESLSVPMGTQYWNGSAFVTSTADGCSLLPLSAITFDGNSIDNAVNRTVALDSGTTTGSIDIIATDAATSAGSFALTFSAPGEGHTGYFPIGVTSIDDWLRYDWNQDGSADDASLSGALVTFGRSRGNDRMIFWQERLQ